MGFVRVYTGDAGQYTLHAVSMPQPSPTWRRTAVKIPSTQGGHFMLEVRLNLDMYDGASDISDGIPSEGVIVYEVQGETEVFLRTDPAMQVGDEFKDTDEGLTIGVLSQKAGGF